MTGDGGEFGGELGDEFAGEFGDGGEPAVIVAMARLQDVLGDAREAQRCAWPLSDPQVRAAVVASFTVVQQAQSVYLSLVRELDGRPSAVAGARAGVVAKSFLVAKLRRTFGQAAQDARAARVLAADADPALGGLPLVGAALAAGEISREHADIAVRAIRHVPAHLLAAEVVADPDDPDPEGLPRCGGAVLDAAITDLARRHDTNGLKNLARHLLDVVDPDGANSFDPNAADRRRLSLSQDSTGMTVVRGELAQPDGALVQS